MTTICPDDFDIVIRRRNGATLAAIPDLGLYGKGADAGAALATLEQRKKGFVEDMKAGLIDPDLFTPRGDSRSGRSRTSGIGLLTVKAGILIALLTFSGLFAAQFVTAKAEKVVEIGRQSAMAVMHQYRTIGGRDFWAKLEKALESASDSSNEMSEERRQKLLASIHTLVQRWRPFVAEAASIFSPEQEPGAKPR